MLCSRFLQLTSRIPSLNKSVQSGRCPFVREICASSRARKSVRGKNRSSSKRPVNVFAGLHPVSSPKERGYMSPPAAASVAVENSDPTEMGEKSPGDGKAPTPGRKQRNIFENGPRITLVNPEEEILVAGDYDIVCDVRSPGEFEEDRLIGARSTPVLDNEQRAQVGTLFKSNAFEAKKLGAALVARNLGKILTEDFQDRPKKTRVLVYCWRGGERSLSLAHVLSRVGFEVSLLQGGYRAYRAQVREHLEHCEKFKFTVIAGRTGSAKGKLLNALVAAGAQVVDLEVAADHRGSILGQEPATNFTQPSQKMFESRLFATMARFDPAKPVFVEGESSRIGIRHVPKSMWTGMKSGTQMELVVPTSCRVQWTRSQYPHYETTHVDKLKKELKTLGKLHPEGYQIADKWTKLADEGDWNTLVEDLLVNHYDVAYARAWKRNYGDAGGDPSVIRIGDISDETFADVAKQLVTTGTFVGSLDANEVGGATSISESLEAGLDVPERLRLDKDAKAAMYEARNEEPGCRCD